jgi:Bacteriocin-protection, YdeI or OmpD-Associated
MTHRKGRHKLLDTIIHTYSFNARLIPYSADQECPSTKNDISQRSETEPELPIDHEAALTDSVSGRHTWDTTTIDRLDWIHWIVSAKQSKTRAKRIENACAVLSPRASIANPSVCELLSRNNLFYHVFHFVKEMQNNVGQGCKMMRVVRRLRQSWQQKETFTSFSDITY